MPVPGEWTLNYDWGCDGAYGATPMTINANGTWSNGEGYSGQWVAVAGELLFKFNDSQTTYAGNLASKSVTGIQTTFSGLNGCFYLLQQGAPTEFALVRRAEGKADSGGGA
jgi:hypothetical protein